MKKMACSFHQRPLVVEKGGLLYVGVRHSLSQSMQSLGAKWCVHERMWRINKNHVNAPILVAMSGYEQSGIINGAVFKDYTREG